MEESIMGQTMVEKILNHAANTCGKTAGEIVNVNVSFLMTNDAVAELAIQGIRDIGTTPWDNDRIAVILDHYVPATSDDAARVHKLMRDFSRENGTHLYDHKGVCHQLMLENHVLPGDVVIGTDSHTCTYGALGVFATGVGSTDGAAVMATGKIWLKIPETIRIEIKGNMPSHVHPKDVILYIIGQLGADGATYQALEFSGPGMAAIDNAGRMTMCNMAIEAGAKTGIVEPDAMTEEYFKNRENKGRFFKSDPDARFIRHMEINLDQLVPQIACPWTVDHVVPVDEVAGLSIDQAFIGSCTNGRIEDLRIAAKVLRGKKVASKVRLLVAPASQAVYLKTMEEGLLNTFINAGAVICNPGCSACFGGQGMLWENEVCIGTHNRNFRGRMGHRDSKVYLASPETTALSAIAGYIVDPGH
jgi:3-isopropylmalate/(R)-2-methylmalate dehydratase large subunit